MKTPAEKMGEQIARDISNEAGSPEDYNSGTPELLNSTIAKSITKYLTENAVLMTTYTGVIPGTPSVPESGTDSHQVTGAVAPPVGEKFDIWLKDLGTKIMNGFTTLSGAMVSPKAPHISFAVPEPLENFITQEGLRGAIKGEEDKEEEDDSKEEDQEVEDDDNKEEGNDDNEEGDDKGVHIRTWTYLAGGIIDMLTTQVSLPFPAGIAGLGTAVVTKIEIT